MISKLTRILCVLIVFLLLLGVLPSCGEDDLMAMRGVTSVRVEKGDRIRVKASLDTKSLETVKGDYAYLYEILPGETSINGKRPVASTKIKSNMDFVFDLYDGDRTRLYSSFLIAFEDNERLDPNPRWIENPEFLAQNGGAFNWEFDPKAITADDVYLAFEDGAMHVSFDVSLAKIADSNGDLIVSALSELDRQISAATASGMQVSLYLSPDRTLSTANLTRALHQLASRYDGGENGCVSAWFLEISELYSPTTLCRTGVLALRSHVSGGRVYMHSRAQTPEEIKLTFSNLSLSLLSGGALDWGISIELSSPDAPWEDASDTLSADDLQTLSNFFFKSATVSHRWLALRGITFPTLDEQQQAAALAYTYRTAREAGFSYICVDAQIHDQHGLYCADGTARRAASVFSDIDSGLKSADLALCKELIGDTWTKNTYNFSTRTQHKGVANLGTTGLDEQLWFDFSDGETLGFFGIQTAEAVRTQTSASFGKSVLLAWVEPLHTANSGVRCVLKNAKELENAASLSARLLAQTATEGSSAVTLSLEGQTDGGSRVSFESSIDVKNRSWQTVTYQIAAFTQSADLSRPVILSLTVEPILPEDSQATADAEEFALWVGDICTRRPGIDKSELTTVVVVVLVTLGVLIFFLLIYYLTTYLSRRRKQGSQAKTRRPKERR